MLTIPNLGGDALMVVPRPMSDVGCYCHLAAFLRGAPEPQRDALWVAVANATLGRVGSKPLWLNTAGGGVAWLHVRLDARPKYYHHMPYKTG